MYLFSRRRPKNRLICQSTGVLEAMACAMSSNKPVEIILPDECVQFMEFIDTSDKNTSTLFDQSACIQLCQMRRSKIATELQVLEVGLKRFITKLSIFLVRFSYVLRAAL